MHFSSWLSVYMSLLLAIAIVGLPASGLSQYRPKPCVENGVECTLECYAPPADLHCPMGARICSSTCGGAQNNERVANSDLPWAALLVAIRLVEFGSITEWTEGVPSEEDILQALKPALIAWISEVNDGEKVEGWYLSRVSFDNGRVIQIAFLSPSENDDALVVDDGSSVIQTLVVKGDFAAIGNKLEQMELEKLAGMLLIAGRERYILLEDVESQ